VPIKKVKLMYPITQIARPSKNIGKSALNMPSGVEVNTLHIDDVAWMIKSSARKLEMMSMVVRKIKEKKARMVCS
jgi:hypothetical protein